MEPRGKRRTFSRLVRTGIATAVVFAFVATTILATPARAAQMNAYVVTPLVSDGGVPAPITDATLVNAWGLVAGPTSPWWVSDNGADASTLYRADGTKVPLTVGVASAPTGVVFNSVLGTFLIGTKTARFIWSTEEGKILGWGGLPSTTASVAVDNSASGAVYKGLAYAVTESGPMIYATDFVNGRVDAFNGMWMPVTTAGGFMDSMLPAGYAPFGIQTIGSRIFVTYGKQSPECCDELHGQGLGFVDAFDFDGNLLVRVAQHGQLNAPWGLAWAPDNFGRFSGDLLVGNFGDGHVNAYQEMANGHFAFRGMLQVSEDVPVAIDGLWALEFGHGSPNNGPTNTLFFTAGPNDESDGLFGTITSA